MEVGLGASDDDVAKGHGGGTAADGHAFEQPLEQAAVEFEDPADPLALTAGGERGEAEQDAEEGPGQGPKESEEQKHGQIDSPWLKDNNTRLLYVLFYHSK